ncbi:MAG: hypothetical protein ACHP9Z_33825, partial [Streptosporangiales bacterium]
GGGGGPPPPPPHTLQLSLGSLATGTVTLTAVGGPVAAYHVTVPALFQPDLSVSQASGSLAAGHSVRLTVSAAAGLLPGAVLDVAPGGATVPVSIQLGA